VRPYLTPERQAVCLARSVAVKMTMGKRSRIGFWLIPFRRVIPPKEGHHSAEACERTVDGCRRQFGVVAGTRSSTWMFDEVFEAVLVVASSTGRDWFAFGVSWTLISPQKGRGYGEGSTKAASDLLKTRKAALGILSGDGWQFRRAFLISLRRLFAFSCFTLLYGQPRFLLGLPLIRRPMDGPISRRSGPRCFIDLPR